MNNKSDHHYTAVSQSVSACMRQTRLQNQLTVGVIALGLALSVAGPVEADTFTVSNTNDSGQGSFRQAILDANTNPGKDEINLSSVSGDISLLSDLPILTGSANIVGPGPDSLSVDGGLLGKIEDASKVKVSGIDFNGFLFFESNIYYYGPTGSGPSISVAIDNVETASVGGYAADIVVTDSKIVDSVTGAGVGIGHGSITVENSVISGHKRGLSTGSYTAYTDAGVINVRNSIISGNEEAGRFNGIINLEGTTVSNNELGFSGNRGAFSLKGSTITATSGDAIRGGWILVSDSVINNNSGAGIFGGNIRIYNSTISNNQRAGIAQSSIISIDNTTVTGNVGGIVGGITVNVGGVINESGNITNSIIAGNSIGARSDINGSSYKIKNCLVENPGTSLISDENLIGLDPLLGPLADNGGPTKTHALLPGSPAIDTAVAATCTATDQRGVVRPQGAGCDMGAYEVEDAVVPPITICDVEPVSVGGNCDNEAVARSVADIDAYVASDFGRHTLANGKKAFKNLRLLGSIGQAGLPLDVVSPCSISLNSGAALTGSDIMLHARQGLSVNWSADIDASGEACLISDRQHALLNGGNVVNADTLAIRGAKKAIVGFQAAINVNGAAELISTGTGGNSNAKVGNKTTVTAERFTMQADNVVELAFRANITTTGEINITSGNLTTSKTRLTNRSSVQAGTDVTVNSGGSTNIGFHTTVTAGNDLDVNAKTDAECSVASITSITYSSKSGNCSNKLP